MLYISIENDDKDDSPMDLPNRNAEKGWSLWDLVRGGWNVREGPSSPTPDSNPPIRPGQGNYIQYTETFFVL